MKNSFPENPVVVRNILTFAPQKANTMGRTVTASIGPHYEEFIQNCILEGRYNNASEVIRAGLRLLEEEESHLAALRAALDEGEASGICENFDPEEHLKQLKASYHKGASK